MPITTVDKRKSADIKVGDLAKKTFFTLVGSKELLIILDINQQYNNHANCFNVTKMSTLQLENHLPACPCDVEIIILDKEVKNGIKA